MTSIFNYTDSGTIIHKLSGLSKLIAFMALTTTVMLTFDIRIILGIMLFSFLVLKISKITFKEIRLILLYVSFFLIMNFFLTFLFEPEYAVGIYGTRHVMFTIYGRFVVTQEQIFYQFTKMMKYASVIPLGIIFLFTTNPSELASSMNRVGVPYKISYALSLTLRYFPDIQREYFIISKAQQARGLDISKKTSLGHRLKYAIFTVIPLIFSSLDRIENISNAMDLRGFSKKKRRTWYSARKLGYQDYFAIFITVGMLVGAIYVTTYINFSRFYNPFI